MNLLAQVFFNARKFWWDRSARRTGRQITFRRHKTTWTVSNKDRVIGFGLFVYGGWQFREIDLVLAWLEKERSLTAESVIVNVGANIGTSAIRLAQRSLCRILAIEPVPDTYDLLKKNVTQNGLSERIICYQAAVYSAETALRMIVPQINPGAAEVALDSGRCTFNSQESEHTFAVARGMPLAQILKAAGVDRRQVVFVWSDTQGCEGHIIRTGTELWEAGVPLVMEFWPLGQHVQGEDDAFGLIRRHFKSYCILPSSVFPRRRLEELPIEQLGNDVIADSSVKDDVDLLLIPRRQKNLQAGVP